MARLVATSTVLGLLAATLLATPASAQTTDPTCMPARAMVLFDRSTSMIRGTIEGKTRWSIATAALKEVVSAYQDKVELGLTVFPKDAGTCKTGGVSVVDPPRLNALASITTELGKAANVPGSNHWTPIGQTLQKLATLPSMTDATRRRFVILVTDGAQSCPEGLNGNPNEADQIWDVATQVLQVKNLKDQGVTTFVIGFGQTSMNPGDDGVDAFALNQLALAGGTAPSGCDANGTDPTAAANCYYQADNADELIGALEEIAIQIQHRECGSDVGECGTGMQTCVNGTWGDCLGETGPQEDVCDGKDNDCDGTADSGCECVVGATRPCGGPDRGTCQTGVQTCGPDGMWAAQCVGGVGATAETCDGKDNDCNGVVDNPNPGLAGGGLCAANQVCQQSSCVTAFDGELAGGAPAGCAIGARAPAPLGLAALALLAGVVVVVARRRR